MGAREIEQLLKVSPQVALRPLFIRIKVTSSLVNKLMNGILSAAKSALLNIHPSENASGPQLCGNERRYTAPLIISLMFDLASKKTN